MDELLVCQLGLVPYEEALALQLALREARIAGRIGDVLLLLEHPAVVTRGRRSGAGDLVLGEAFLQERGVDVITTQRGGLATYHGPGMLVGYPIVGGITDVVGYLRTLELAIISALAEESVAAYQRPSTDAENLTGVWVGEPARKIASLGVHLSHGTSIHGFAIGADNDLEPWQWFTACGLPSVTMTSVAAETGRQPTLPCLRKRVAVSVARQLGQRQRLISRARLEQRAGIVATASTLR
jgi:lipoyl(octanoyl) transferase